MRFITPYWSTRSLAADLFDEMDRFFNVYDERTVNPACEISEADDHYYMSIDLPGMKREDIKIEANGDVLTISGERKRESSDGRKIQRYERSYGFFKRSFTIPSVVDADKIEAHYENGVLELYLPKTQAARPRQIEIQSGKGGFLNRFLGGKKSDVKDVQNA